MKLFAPKAAKEDFTHEQMPHNRKEVFVDVLKLHWKDFLLMGLLVLAFSLPIHYVGLFREIRTDMLMAGYEAASEEARLEIIQQVRFLHNTCTLWEIPCLLLLSVCLSGLLRVIRQYGWEENVYFRSDFVVGIRQNVKQSLVLALLVGVVSFLVQWCANASVMQENAFAAMVMSAPLMLAVLCGIPVASYAAAVISVYNSHLLQKLSVGLLLTAKNPVKTLGALLVCVLPLALYLIPGILLHVVVRILYSVLLPMIMLGWFLFASDRLDIHVYPDCYPQLIGRGIIFEGEKEQ